MKKQLKTIIASVSALCSAAVFCTSLTVSAVSFTPSAVIPRHSTLWNQYWHSNYGNIVLDYCTSKQDYQDYRRAGTSAPSAPAPDRTAPSMSTTAMSSAHTAQIIM